MFLPRWSWRRVTVTQILSDFFDDLRKEWNREDKLRMRKIAWRYSDRMLMDGAVIRKTGEIVPRESA